MNKKILSTQVLLSDISILISLSFIKLLIHVLSNGQYGYFRDELYYLACTEHMDWGYVDQPPFTIVVAYISRHLFGDSLFSLRFFPAIAGALTVLVTGLITRRLGGGRFSQILSGIAVIVAPVFLGMGNLLTMNVFDQLFWVLSAYLIITILQTGDQRLWLLFGLIAGIALENKLTMLFFGFALLIALLITPRRNILLYKYPWYAGFIAFLILIPFLIWQTQNDWATFKFYTIYSQGKTYPATPLEFLMMQIITMHPFTLPLWLAGLYYCLVSKDGKQFRVMGLIYVILFFLILYMQGKFYHLSPAYPWLFASGSLMVEKIILLKNWNWLKPAYVSMLIVGGLLIAPLALPILPINLFIKYTSILGQNVDVKTERHKMGILPQVYADMFGWENMTSTVARVYNSLTPDEQAKCCIITGNYGEAGAIDFFGRKYNLPKAISLHNSYYLWGPGNCTGEIVISIGQNGEGLKKVFNEVSPVDTIRCEYAMPYENNLPVYICRGLKWPIKEVWSQGKHYD